MSSITRLACGLKAEATRFARKPMVGAFRPKITQSDPGRSGASRKGIRRHSAAALFSTLVTIALLPQVTAACAICFGAADSPLLAAARLGVIVMAVVTLAVLSAFGRWFLKLRRLERDRTAQEPS